jgi:SAM-dependent methyltransferase
METDAALHDITETNRAVYNALWSNSSLVRPDRFNTWPLIASLLPDAPDRLEIGPGLRPRLPVKGTNFLDLSSTAVEKLNAGGGNARQGHIGHLPFDDNQFDLICAFDVIEHVSDDRKAFGEICRVLKDNGILVISVPLHAHCWTELDEWGGHARRYEPADLQAMLDENRLQIEKSAVFGMQPSNPKLLQLGLWCLKNSRPVAMSIYNNLFLPLGMYFQKELHLVSGLVNTNAVDEIVLVCRRGARVH